MLSRFLVLGLTFAAAATALAAPTLAKWPPWLSIESPVNPFDAAARNGAVMLVHAPFREGIAKLSDISGTAEGIVNGQRKSITLHFDSTARPGVFAVSRQWPNEGTWLVRVALQTTTALVTFDRAGNVASVRVPTMLQGNDRLPRAVGSKEIDSTLAEAAKR